MRGFTRRRALILVLPLTVLFLSMVQASTVKAARTWHPGPALLQGNNQCVGYSWAEYLAAEPKPITVSGLQVYIWAKQIDHQFGWDDGSDIEYAGTQLLSKGYISGVQYTNDPQYAAWWIANIGPIVIESRWLWGMNMPLGDVLVPTGQQISQHAYMCYEWNNPYFRCQDTDYPYNFRLSIADLAPLLIKVALPTK